MRRESRPVYLDLLHIRQPFPAIVSFAHRVSGVLLTLAIPASIYLLEISLQSPAGYRQALAILGNPLIMLIVALLTLSLLHHLAAGIRFLLLDLEIGEQLEQARLSAKAVLAIGPVLTVVFLLVWWL